MRRFAIAMSAALLGCATAQGRAYERAELASLPLRSVAIHVASAAPTESGPQLAIDPLPPITHTATLALATTDEATRAALADAVRAELEAKGYAVDALDAGSVAETRSEADVVLAVRVQPVDRFFVSTWSDEERERARLAVSTQRPPMGPRVGRLMVGQAYAFDRRTGLRLWSRDAIDLPDDGWLHPDSALLAYGVVGARPPERLAVEAARAFVAETFASFPAARAGDKRTRAALDAIDPEVDAAMLAKVDRTRWQIGVDTGWSFDTIETRVEGIGDGVSIDERAIAPAGTFRVTPRFDVRFPGGVTIGAGLALGIAPGSFGRGYVVGDRGVRVAFSAPEHIGLRAAVAYDRYLSPSLHVRPGVGFFIDGWRLGADPRGVVEGDAVARIGALAELAVLYDVADAFFVLGGARGRAGAVPRGSLSLGLEGFVGIGVAP